MCSLYSMCKHVCESLIRVCFLQPLLERCVGRDITVNNIRDEKVNDAAWAHWQLTHDVFVRVGMCVSATQQCIRKRGLMVFVQCIWVTGWPQAAGKKMILSKYLVYFLFPLVKIFFTSLQPFALIFFLLPHLCHLLPPFRLLFLFLPRFLLNISLISTSPPHLCYQRPEMDHRLHRNGCCSTFFLFAFIMAHSGFPLEHAMTWQWRRGRMEGELQAVKSEGAQQTLKK